MVSHGQQERTGRLSELGIRVGELPLGADPAKLVSLYRTTVTNHFRSTFAPIGQSTAHARFISCSPPRTTSSAPLVASSLCRKPTSETLLCTCISCNQSNWCTNKQQLASAHGDSAWQRVSKQLRLAALLCTFSRVSVGRIVAKSCCDFVANTSAGCSIVCSCLFA